MTQAVDLFADIRPYNDDEVSASIQRLVNDNAFIDLIAKHNLPSWLVPFRNLLTPLLKRYLAKKWSKFKTIEQIQQVVAHYLGRVIDQTTSKVTFSGLEHLDKKQAYLFISNHRDIALDPALINWGLHTHQMNTVRIAIGDNLLQIPYITELMKLNKSFVVKRSVKAPKEMLRALSQLSAYIYDSLQNNHSIWIAQREGRTKDGDDQTDPALLKMLQLNGRKQKMEFADYVRELKIVPVSISYQFEPCAIAKAKERYHKNTFGEYKKAAGEDIESIMEGFRSSKGHIHVAFGQPITSECDNPELLAQTIDKQILSSYFLHPGNYLAANIDVEQIEPAQKELFEERMAQVPEELKELVLAMYAKPVYKQADQHL